MNPLENGYTYAPQDIQQADRVLNTPRVRTATKLGILGSLTAALALSIGCAENKQAADPTVVQPHQEHIIRIPSIEVHQIDWATLASKNVDPVFKFSGVLVQVGCRIDEQINGRSIRNDVIIPSPYNSDYDHVFPPFQGTNPAITPHSIVLESEVENNVPIKGVKIKANGAEIHPITVFKDQDTNIVYSALAQRLSGDFPAGDVNTECVFDLPDGTTLEASEIVHNDRTANTTTATKVIVPGAGLNAAPNPAAEVIGAGASNAGSLTK